ncbi:MAG: glycerophosphodiester phosphodiesterase family protein [Cyclobacteriaceae bacterium]
MRLFLILLVVCSCSSTIRDIDIQGHRGARGVLPENTIPGFIKAIDLGVNTLELDLGITGDQQILVSHDPYLSYEICADTTGQRVPSDTLFNIYQMTYEEVSKYDCGSVVHPRFEDQKKMKVSKPLLKDVLETVEHYLSENELPRVNYNIELKTRIEYDDVYHPVPGVFSEMVFGEIDKFQLWDRVTIQSFDFRTLKYFHEKYPKVRLALLIENRVPWNMNIDSLGFTPDVYSCNYQLLSRKIIGEIQKAGMLVIPWTVNETKEMTELIEWGVDGIITDYPDRAVAIKR